MNLTLDRFLYGILGAILGACSSGYASMRFYGSPNFKIIIIVSAVAFIAFFFLGFHIINLMSKIFYYIGGHVFRNK